MITVPVQASKPYEVHIGNGAAFCLEQELSRLVRGKNVAVISDTTVWSLYGESLVSRLEKAGFTVSYLCIAPGEASKSAANFIQILEFLAENGFHREDCIIALGGGVTGDLAGFAAACYMRGMAYIQIPTSLLAMVDSSVGGKTAVNINQELPKNICGAFHQPVSVLCDPAYLASLPDKNFREGCAEIIKYAILFDPELFDHLEAKGLDFDREWVISRCIGWKADTVSRDELDTGVRHLLNFGHTLGHAIETESGFQVSHGEAVATGMAIVTRAAGIAGICEDATVKRILALLQKFGLPTDTEYCPEFLCRNALSDKKATGCQIPVIVPEAIGRCRMEPMEEASLLRFIRQGCRKDRTVFPGLLAGTLEAPTSKSYAHRALICAAISPTPTHILCADAGKDVHATVSCLRRLGASITETEDGFWVEPIRHIPYSANLNCGESGTTLRLLLPLAGALGVNANFYMEGRLSQRPLSPLWEEMERMGCHLSAIEDGVRCAGKLHAGDYRIDGSVSSQFISGLKIALTLLPGSTLTVTGPVQSRPYIAMTDAVLTRFPCETFAIEKDWSSAAFFLGANALGSQITVNGLCPDSLQADREILSALEALEENATISARDIPDLIPILAVVAACKQGATFTQIGRLRLKESDRVEAIVQMLRSLGANAAVTDDTLQVFPASFTGGTVNSFADHRIAMAAAIAATVCKEPVVIQDAACVQKSYPQFWEHFAMLGGKL